MNDYQRAIKNIGNSFDMVLVASERMRELHRERRRREDSGDVLSFDERKKYPAAAHQAITEIENGDVGKEYLLKISKRSEKTNRKR